MLLLILIVIHILTDNSTLLSSAKMVKPEILISKLYINHKQMFVTPFIIYHYNSLQIIIAMTVSISCTINKMLMVE